jgi:hypothetical protein
VSSAYASTLARILVRLSSPTIAAAVEIACLLVQSVIAASVVKGYFRVDRGQPRFPPFLGAP